MCRSILSLSKIAHQLWHDPPLSQRNGTADRAVGVRVRSERYVGVGGRKKFENRRVRPLFFWGGGGGVFIK